MAVLMLFRKISAGNNDITRIGVSCINSELFPKYI